MSGFYFTNTYRINYEFHDKTEIVAIANLLLSYNSINTQQFLSLPSLKNNSYGIKMWNCRITQCREINII